MATIHYPSGRSRRVKPKKAKNGFELHELYEHLQCSTIQIIGPNRLGTYMICDEEGKLKSPPLLENKIGTAWMWSHFRVRDTVVGRIIFCNKREIK